MKIAEFAHTLGVDWRECGCANVLREKMKTHKQPEYCFSSSIFIICF